MALKREAKIRKAVEDKLWHLLKGDQEIPKEQLQAVSLGIKYLAVSAKLGEADWGKDLMNLDEPDDPTKDLDVNGDGGEDLEYIEGGDELDESADDS